MKTRSPMKKLAAMVVGASALVGCSVNPPSTTKLPVTPPALTAPTFQVLGEAEDADKAEQSKKMQEFLAQLALTEAQKTQLKSVIKGAFERAKPIQAAIKPLATAPEVDRTALKAAIEVAMKADAAQDAQTLEEVKQVLTESQRMLIANKLNEMATKKDDPHMKMIDKLIEKASEQITMTTEQKEAFSKLKSAMHDFWMENRGAYYKAMATHMTSGSQADLQAEFTRLNAGIPTDAMVTFTASLDQSQRQKLVAWKEGLMERIASKLSE